MSGTERIMRRLELRNEGTGKYAPITAIMKNNSGGALAKGDIVILDTTESNSVTTTTSAASPLVWGMADEAIASAAKGRILMQGWTDSLKVDGTTDIAVGDEIATSTTVKIGAKASAGQPTIAIALEAYSTNDSLGVIDAMVHFPHVYDASSTTVTYGTAGQMAADGLAASNGAGSTAATARIDHAHAYTNDTPAPVWGTSNATGTVGKVMASDASLAIFDATAPTSIGFADAAAVGTAAFAARRDHAHASLAASTAPIDGSSLASADAVGTSSAIARADHAHQAILLDDVVLARGTDSDVGEYMPSGGVTANTAKAGVLEGTPVTQASPNGSLITGVVTDGGDWMVAVSPAGNSLEAIRVDSSASQVQLGEGILDTVQWDGTGLIVGSNTQRTVNALVPEFQVQGTTVGVDGAALVALYSATAGEGPELILARSKSGTLGTNTIVDSGDRLGRIVAMGADGGTGFDPSAAIQFEVDGTPGAATDMPGRILFLTSPDASQTPTEAFRIKADQNTYIADGNGLVIGGSAVQLTIAGIKQEFQVYGSADADSSMALHNGQATAASGFLVMSKSRAAPASFAIVQNGDALGTIRWTGDDGVDYGAIAAEVVAEVDAAPGVGDMPGRLVFKTTADGAETTTEVFRATSAQNLAVGNGNGLFVGALTPQTAVDASEFQVQGTAAADASALVGLWSTTDALAPIVRLLKSGNATIGSFTTVADAELLGDLEWVGDNGTDYNGVAARIRGEVDGTVSGTAMPGLLRFMVSDAGAEAPTSRMVIGSPGYVIIGTTDTTTFTASAGTLVFDEISAATGTATNQAQIYAYDSATVSVMAQQKSDGTNADL